MKIAFTATGIEWDSAIDPRFGRTEFLLIYDEQSEDLTSLDNRSIANVAHGAGPQTAQKLLELNPEILITGNGPGGNAARALEQSGIKIYIGAGSMTVKQAYEAFKNGELNQT
jgi:predicted Fe-Mo cluster-binding NifX family protein